MMGAHDNTAMTLGMNLGPRRSQRQFEFCLLDRQPMTDFQNQLIDETSPYLRQHAHNPVDWYPWNARALEKARDEDKPILLSIGYSACHWCHVCLLYTSDAADDLLCVD